MATQTKRPDRTVHLEFEVRDPDSFFVGVTAELEGELVGRSLVPRSDGELLEYFEVRGMDLDALRELGEEWPAVRNIRVIENGDDAPIVEVVVRGACVGKTLADENAIARNARASDGVGRFTVVVPSHTDAEQVCDALLENHPDTELVEKHQREDGSLLSEWDPIRELLDRLTDRQREALTVAVESGYFAWPRQSSADECADAMGVSQPTFSQHLRRAEERILRGLIEAA